MICDFIIECMLYNTECKPIVEKEWDYLFWLGEELHMDDIMAIAIDPKQHTAKEFKTALLRYCKLHGYEGSPMHSKLKRLPYYKIEKMLGRS